jgi:hypothetical protein
METEDGKDNLTWGEYVRRSAGRSRISNREFGVRNIENEKVI